MKHIQTYSIKEVSELSGLSESTLRYYETIGIISPIGRDPSSRHRVYDEKNANMVTAIACLNATGMSIDDMREYIKNVSIGKRSAKQQTELLMAQKSRLALESHQLKIRRQYVDLKISYWQAIDLGNNKKADEIALKAKELVIDLKNSIK